MIPISRLIDSSINSYGNVKIYKEVAGKIQENVNIIHNESHIKKYCFSNRRVYYKKSYESVWLQQE